MKLTILAIILLIALMTNTLALKMKNSCNVKDVDNTGKGLTSLLQELKIVSFGEEPNKPELKKTAWKDIPTLDYAKLPVKLNWDKVRRLFAAKDKVKKEEILKFLTLRAIDIKMTLERVIEGKKQEKISGSIKNITGNNEAIEISKLTVKFAPTKDYHHVGKMVIASTGSVSYTSDIDYTLSFTEMDGTKEKTNNDLVELTAVSIFISRFNSVFHKLHRVSSATSYDVNLYSKNFGYKSLIDKIKTLTPKEKTVFDSANRLSVILLIYNDSLNALKRVNPKQGIKRPTDTIKKLYDASKPDNYKCGELLLYSNPLDAIRKEAALDVPRSENFQLRNKSMTDHFLVAGQSSSDTFKNLCHVLAANYFALEAYVPVGSIFEMGRMYGFIDNHEQIDIVKKLSQNHVIEAVLMNFAYAVEHFYHSIKKEDYVKVPDSFSLKYLSKYAGRIFKIAQELNDDTHKKCWNDALSKLGIIAGKDDFKKPKDTADKIIAFLESTQAVSNSVDSPYLLFANQGYDCVKTHGFNMVPN